MTSFRGGSEWMMKMMISSPCLYSTPDSSTFSTSQNNNSSLSPPPSSAYVINHKRRGPRLREQPQQSPQQQLQDVVADNGKLESSRIERGGESEDDLFFDVDDSLSMRSWDDVVEYDARSRQTGVSQYYDAFEEVSSNSVARSFSNIKDELSQMRVNWLIEVEKRKQAEEALQVLRSKWEMLTRHISLVGPRFAIPLVISEEANEELEIEELCRQIVVTHYVSDAIDRAFARAEVELEMEAVIESKNFEIARLSDRLHYYETANKEMSERNQETVEMARKLRIKRKRRLKWFWGSIGLTVTLGAAAIAWSSTAPASSSGQSYEGIGENPEN